MVSLSPSSLEAESVPELNSGTTGPEGLHARAFGLMGADLDISFAGQARPVVVTALLRGCLRDGSGDTFSESELWQWTILRRTRALLSVAIATSGPQREITERCPNAACGETMQINLDLRTFRDSGGTEDRIRVLTADGTDLVVRLPTANDQLRLRQLSPADALHFAASLVDVECEFRPEWLPEIEAALEEHDPLTSVQLETQCPYCETPCSIDLDLEALMLRELERVQAGLLDCVHRIACAYGWGEEAVLALPEHRRRYYLERIDMEAGA